MALTALAVRSAGRTPTHRRALLLVGVLGAALFYGDSVITPAISVLGAAEGLEVVAPSLASWVLPISVGVLLGLFSRAALRHAARRRDVRAGDPALVRHPRRHRRLADRPGAGDPAAPRPAQAFQFLQAQGWHLFIAVGAIVLASPAPKRSMPTWATSAAADPHRLARRGAAALAINYMGQGALLMREPAALANPFFRMFSEAWLIPAVLLAFCAAVIASQAVISGAYSMTRQAIQLGFLPRMRIVFTSASEAGRSTCPGEPDAAGRGARRHAGLRQLDRAGRGLWHRRDPDDVHHHPAHFFVVRHGWGYPLPVALAATGAFLAFDALLVISCGLKFADGGWFPLVLGAAIFALMATWKRGRELLQEHCSATTRSCCR
jgi:KUP system potassium uptake protein